MKLFDGAAQVFINGQPAGWTREGAIDADEPPAYPRIAEPTISTTATFTWPPGGLAELYGLNLTDAPPPCAATFTSVRPRRLRTGELGTKRRVDHARALRMGTWLRSRERRHGIAAVAPLTMRIHFPHIRAVLR